MSVFSWFNPRRRDTSDVTKLPPRRPGSKDASASLSANSDMLLGLYHGTYPGLEFASALAFVPIHTPVVLMGIPTPTSDDKRTKAVLDEIVEAMSESMPKLHRTSLILGTGWRWPRFDAKTQELVWEAIPDNTVSDILVDVTTGRPKVVLTHDTTKLSVGENQYAFLERKRRFEEKIVTVKYYGDRSVGVEDYTTRNLSGILPVAFPNDTDEGDIRGHSSLSRIIRDLKDYHDIDYRRSETISKFRVKMVQTSKNIKTWLAQNGIAEGCFADVDFYDKDFVLNLFGDETTKYEFLPQGATDAYTKALEGKFWKIVEGSGIPELFWGPLATGNHATTEEQMQQAVSYVESLRTQWLKPYQRLFSASLSLLSTARMERYDTFTMGWNRLDALSAKTKSEIFRAFAVSVAQLAQSAMITKQQVYDLWKANYPEIPVGEFEEWVEGIRDMAAFRQFLGLDYGSGLEDFQGDAK